MYKKILAALDYSLTSEVVFESALELAKATGSELILLHALSQEADDSPLSYAPVTMSYNPEKIEEYQRKWREFEDKCREKLAIFAERAQAKGINPQIQQISGNPGRIICQFAQEENVDLIIMGRRGHSLVEEMFMGSVSNYVLHRSHHSVLVVQS